MAARLFSGALLVVLVGCQSAPERPIGEWKLDLAESSRRSRLPTAQYAGALPPIKLYSNGRFEVEHRFDGTWKRSKDRIEFTTDGISLVAERLFGARSELFVSRFTGDYLPKTREIVVTHSDDSQTFRRLFVFRRAGNAPSIYADPSPLPAIQTSRQANIDRSLLASAMDGRVRDIKALLDLGANPNVHDDNLRRLVSIRGATPLHLVAGTGNIKVAELLLQAGAKVEEKDVHGNVPLHYASITGHRDFVNLLIERGASPGTKNSLGETPEELAIRSGQPPRDGRSNLPPGKSSAEGNDAIRNLRAPVRYADRSRYPIPVVIAPMTARNLAYPNATVGLNPRKPTVILDAPIVNRYSPRVLDFVVLHETAHLLRGHIQSPSVNARMRIDREFEADAFAQAVFLGWGRDRDLSEVSHWMEALPGDPKTHPDGFARIVALQKRIEPFRPVVSDLHDLVLEATTTQIPRSGQPLFAILRSTFRNSGTQRLSLRVRGAAQLLRKGQWITIDSSVKTVVLEPGESNFTTFSFAWPSNFGMKLRMVKPSLEDGSVWIAKRG